jgi:bacteriocin biosynthesis cyclodehydratase domain-containing protein
MSAESNDVLYKAAAVHIFKYEDGAIIKRGTLETYVRGESAFEVLQTIFDQAAKGTTVDEFLGRFPVEDRTAVDQIVHSLIERRLLIPAHDEMEFERATETPENIFYWEFNQNAESVRARLREMRIVIVGVNEISRELVSCLTHSGFEDYQVVDYERLRNRHFYRDDGELDMDRWSEVVPTSLSEWETAVQHTGVACVVATADHGGLHWLRSWNDRCLAHRQHFFPVVLQNLIGYVGPYVIPGETACFECLRARQNANLSRPDQQRASEMVAFESQDVLGYHPLMPRAVAQTAAMELVKFCSGVLPFARVGSLIEVDLMTPALTTRKVLRIPSCPVCGSMHRYAPASTSPIEKVMPGR